MGKNYSELLDVPIHQISKAKYQPRVKFDQEALEELADSIDESGVLSPITLRVVGMDKYELISPNVIATRARDNLGRSLLYDQNHFWQAIGHGKCC